jgi:hypothetical protein
VARLDCPQSGIIGKPMVAHTSLKDYKLLISLFNF